ncbi:MAG: class I SAM-dependent methyltransferase [Pirellulaceae bacterium]
MIDWYRNASSRGSLSVSHWADAMGAALSPWQRAMLEEQRRLQERARKKVAYPHQWLWTAPLLEQSSDQWTAEMVAQAVPAGVACVDLCCGGGVEAVAWARGRSRDLVAIDQDPIALMLTKFHAELQGAPIAVELGAAERFEGLASHWVHVDPDRRHNGLRHSRAEQMSPTLDQLVSIRENSAGGSIKLAPATVVPDGWRDATGSHWISFNRSVRQQRLWWGSEQYPVGTKTLSRGRWMERGAIDSLQVHWIHLQIPSDWRGPEPMRDVSQLDLLARYVGDCDPVVRASDSTVELAGHFGVSVLGDRNGYLLADRPVRTAWVDWFEIQEVMPWDRKRVRRWLRERGIGRLEIKTRGVKESVDALRGQLALSGDREATLLLTQVNRRVFALLAQRLGSQPESPGVREPLS